MEIRNRSKAMGTTRAVKQNSIVFQEQGKEIENVAGIYLHKGYIAGLQKKHYYATFTTISAIPVYQIRTNKNTKFHLRLNE